MGGPGLDIASTWDGFAATVPERVAVASGARRSTWEQFAERANRLAWHLEAEVGLAHGDRVAIALANTSEYLEVFYASLKLGCVPVNVDVRQATTAIHAILDHSDAKVVVHAVEDATTIRTAVKRIGRPWRPKAFSVGDGYERAIAGAPSSAEWQPVGGAPDDLVVIYSDASTVPPTALMWRSADLADALRSSTESGRADGTPAIVMPVAPLTHTLGLFGACRPLVSGGSVVLVRVDPFDRLAVWDAVERERVVVLELPSDGSAAKLADTLDSEPRRWELSSVEIVTCAGRLGETTKRRLAAHLPHADIREPRASQSRTATELLRVVDDVTGRDVEPGSGDVGLLAAGGAIPLGYYKDPEKTAIHFRTIDHTRYWLSGEHVTVDAQHGIRGTAPDPEIVVLDGTRVSTSAVEFVLRKHRSVAACMVVGITAPPIGDQLVALIEITDGHYLDAPEMTAWCRSQLTAPQTPSRFLFVDSVVAITGAAGDRIAAKAGHRPRAPRRGLSQLTFRKTSADASRAVTLGKRTRNGYSLRFAEPRRAHQRWLSVGSPSGR